MTVLSVVAVLLSGGLAVQVAGAQAERLDELDLTAQADPGSAGFEVGVRFSVLTAGAIHGLTLAKGDNATQRPVALWRLDGTLLARSRTRTEGASGRQTAYFTRPVEVTPGIGYIAGYWLRGNRPPTTASDPPYSSAGVRLDEFLTGPGQGPPRTITPVDHGLRLIFEPVATTSAESG